MIKTFRGMLADGGQDHIRLQTIKGKVGYKITKFQILMEQPGNTAQESVVQIYKTKQATVPTAGATINFTDSDLLAAAFQDTNVHFAEIIIFDSEIFNQDIYITYTDNGSGTSEDCNYYLELEVIPLDDAGAEYTTLKDLRQV